MEKYANKLLVDFSGGVNRFVSRLLMADNECYTIQNGELAKVGSINKVKGYSTRGNVVNDGYHILGAIGAYKPSSGTLKQIVVCDNASDSDAYTFNPVNGAWTPHGLSLTSGSKAEFESFLDGFFMVNFTEATRFNDLTQWYTTTNVTDAPRGKYVKQYKSRLYIAYCVDGGVTYPSRVIYSDLPTGTSTVTIGWNNALNYFDVDTDDGDVIKGLAVNIDRLLVFKENSLHRYDTNTLYKVAGAPGTVSHRSIQNILGLTLYLHSSGLWAYDGSTSTFISRKIQEIIDGVSTFNLVNACAYVKGDHYLIYLGDISNTTTGLTIDKCLLDYDVAKKCFSWRSISHNPTVFFEYRDDNSAYTWDDATVTYDSADVTYDGILSSEKRLFFGDDSGYVFQQDTGKSFSGNEISFLVETPDYYLDYPSNFKLFQKVDVFVQEGQGVTIQAKIDDKDWVTLGRTGSEITELIFPTATRGRKIRFRISEISQTKSYSFEGFNLFYTLEGLIE